MWQSPNQRGRSIANARKRERERLRHPFHVRRVAAELKIPQKTGDPIITDARVILNDLSATGISLFSTKSLLAGQEVFITLSEPKPLTIRGHIVACQEYDNDSHILSSSNFPYRLGIQFVFASLEEEKALQTFCDNLNKNYLFGSKAA